MMKEENYIRDAGRREMKFGVSDIRLFNSCNLEFLRGIK